MKSSVVRATAGEFVLGPFGSHLPAALMLFSLVVSGCAREANPPGAEVPTATDDTPGDAEAPEATKYRIGDSFATYYTSSPAQGRPPDGEIPPGTIVEVVERAGSYSRVQWDGKTVWVASDAIEAE